MTALTLSFQETQFNVIDRNGQPWLKGSEVATALGYKSYDAISRIYRRNSDEFTDAMTGTVKLTVLGNLETEHRIFSLRGCHLLAMLARTKVAKEFRKWVLDILDKEVSTGKTTPKGALTPDEYAELLEKRGKIIVDRDDTTVKLISVEQQDILSNLMAIRFPEGKDRPYGWSRFNRHFVISSYKHLRAERFAEACCYIPAMPDKEVKALPAPKPEIQPPVWTKPDPAGTEGAVGDMHSVKQIISDLKVWSHTLPFDIGYPLWNALEEMNNLMVTSYADITEALVHFNMGADFLNRWLGRRRNGQTGNAG